MDYAHPAMIPLSKDLFFDWIGPRIPCASQNIKGDTYPVAWADDGELYVGTGDPLWMVKDGENYLVHGGWNESEETYQAMSGLVVEQLSGTAERFEVSRVHDMPGFTGPGGGGPKPTGMLCVDGVLYFAVQNLLGNKRPRFEAHSQHGSDATILRSDDHGKTWTPDLHGLLADFEAAYYDRSKGQFDSWTTPDEERESFRGWTPMFPGSLFGGPSFVQFGRNNADAVDGYVYAVSGDQWDNGHELRLGRVAKERILERSCWEFAVPDEEGGVAWTAELADSRPVLTLPRHIGAPEMVYVASLRKYLLLTWSLHSDFDPATGSELTILEADQPWGPFSLVHYEWMWDSRAVCPYCPRIPLKWFDPETLEGYLLHSGNWVTGTYYLPQVRKFKLSLRS